MRLIVLILIVLVSAPGISSAEPVSEDSVILGTGLSQAQLKRLQAYRAKVEATSYDVTMKLCEGYRRVIDEKPDHHKDWVFTRSEAFAQWTNIVAKGLYQPIDGIAGLKGDLISARGLGMLDLDFWFGSAYVYFLVTSDGFFNAAFHCLSDKVFKKGTMEMSSKPLDRFAGTIVAFDYESSLLAEVGISLTLGKVIQLIGKASKAFKWFHGLGAFTKRFLNKKIKIYKGIYLSPKRVLIGSALGGAVWLAKIARDQARFGQAFGSAFSETMGGGVPTWENDATYRFALLSKFFRLYESNEGSTEAGCSWLKTKESDLRITAFALRLEKDRDEVLKSDRTLTDFNGLDRNEIFYHEVPQEYSQMITDFIPRLKECY